MEKGKAKMADAQWPKKMVWLGLYVLTALILVAIPPFLPEYIQNLLTQILVFAIFAMSLDLLLGYTGLFSLGHAAFFGVGGYTAAIMIVKFGITSFWIEMLAVVTMTAIVSAVFGFISLRVSGLYFLMVTFALGQLLSAVAFNWFDITGGAFGLKGVPLPDLNIPFLSLETFSFYYLTFAIFIVCYLLLRAIVNSPFGHSLRGIRENETRMRALGYNTWLNKYIIFIIAGIFAGISGMLFAHWNMLISPRHLGITTSALGWFYVIVGGAGTLIGPVIGTAVVIIIEFYSSLYIADRWPLVLGILFIATVMFFRGGIYTKIAALMARSRPTHGGSSNGLN